MRLHTGEKNNRLLLTVLGLHVMIKPILEDEDAE